MAGSNTASTQRSSNAKTSYKAEDFKDVDYFDAIETDPNRSRANWVVGKRPKIDESTLIVGPRDMTAQVAFDADAESVFQLLRSSLRHI